MADLQGCVAGPQGGVTVPQGSGSFIMGCGGPARSRKCVADP